MNAITQIPTPAEIEKKIIADTAPKAKAPKATKPAPKITEPKNAWDEETLNALKDMWLWGHNSRTISETLKWPTRNAVMGKLNRSGMMKRGGERIGSTLDDPYIDQDIMLEELATITGGPIDWSSMVDRILVVQMTALMVGRYAKPIAEALDQDESQVEEALDLMEKAGTWRQGESPPAVWWKGQEGNVAILLDAMVAAGEIAFVDRDGERYYGMPGTLEG